MTRLNINNLRYAADTTLVAESEQELKSLLMRVKEESEKAGLKLNFPKLRSCYLVPSQIEGEKVEVVLDFISWAPRSLWTVIAAMKLEDTCSWKAMTNLDSALKSRDITC